MLVFIQDFLKKVNIVDRAKAQFLWPLHTISIPFLPIPPKRLK